MWPYVAVFFSAMAVDSIPIFAPPAWPILIFFLALFGIVSPRFLWKNIRYAVLAVFIVAAVICPSPDPWTMCIYAIPMLALYMIGILVAWWVHPERRRAKEAAAR